MGKAWDAFVPPPAVWDECLRVLVPGGHMLVFAGSRTYDLMGLSIRLAGFEIRDGLQWLYGSGFPKGQDVGKAIDKAAGATREVVGTKSAGASSLQRVSRVEHGYRENLTGVTPESINVTAPATDDARRWDGWNTALKPGHEPIVLARKPLGERTVARNVLAHGTGAINVDGCRVSMSDADRDAARVPMGAWTESDTTTGGTTGRNGAVFEPAPAGRWPANVLLDKAAAAELDAQSGTLSSGGGDRGATSRDDESGRADGPGQRPRATHAVQP